MAKDVRHLRVVSEQPAKPRRTHGGAPIICKTCNNRNLIELKQPTFRDGKVVKGTHSSWMCPFCQRIVWP